ncbi:MAG: hypothetical protein JRJ47_00435 [Deltaproteobacteria bacterium]|nr:hypothetical protein [Deltaproteobacteria bacterium]
MTSAIDKVCVIPGSRDETKLKELNEFLSRLFPYLNLTCNIYVLATSLSEGMPQVEHIQKGMKTYLKENWFVRYYLHFLHPLPQGGTGDLDYYEQYYYHPWRRGSSEFDREGYEHEEVPRLMLIPALVPGEEDDELYVKGFLEALKERFPLQSLCLREGTFSLAQNTDLRGKAEKVYYGPDPSRTPTEIGCNLFAQDLLETSCIALRSGKLSMTSPCAPSLFITADDGLIYPCMDAFKRGEALTGAYAGGDPETIVKQCEVAREEERDCKGCREYVIRQFSGLPLPRGLQSEVGALLDRIELEK